VEQASPIHERLQSQSDGIPLNDLLEVDLPYGFIDPFEPRSGESAAPAESAVHDPGDPVTVIEGK